ncbi:MAG: DUF5698 domain-containing protein [Bacillota bacterium]|nr:DUF5698 domain-containing protein [Bacillota bacterium]
MDFLNFFLGSSIWVYAFIFFGKIVEVTIATVRIVLINRGERLIGSLVALAEVLLWIIVTGTVLIGFQKDIIKVLVFAVAFATGNYIGSWLEEKLAFGLCSVQVIVNEDESTYRLVDKLRNEDFGVTMMDGKGKDGKRQVLILNLKRKRIDQAIKIVQDNVKEAVITVSDVKVAYGGYLKK